MDTPIIDANVWHGAWPFQRFPFSGLGSLRDHLVENGISAALTSPLGAVFYADPDEYNRELMKEARSLPEIIAVPVLNLRLPLSAWQSHLKSYQEEYGVRAVRIMPSYHDYKLNSRSVYRLIEQAEGAGLKLQITVRMEDERTRYFGLKVRPIKVKSIVSLHQRFPDVDFVVLNAFLPEIRQLGKQTKTIGVDSSFAEWFWTMEGMLEEFPASRLFLGTHSPLLYTGASLAKVRDATISNLDKRRILGGNVSDWLGR